MYDRTTVQGATFNMRGQLYRGNANATAFFSSPVVSALGSESDDAGSSPGRGKALCPWDVREKKNASSAFWLGLIYILEQHIHGYFWITYELQQGKRVECTWAS